MPQEVRERIYSLDEQRKLLQACQNVYRRNLYSLILCAFDSGSRRRRIAPAEWCEVDLDRGELHITAFNAKTNRPHDRSRADHGRGAAHSLRAERKLTTDLVFGITDNFTKGWKNALIRRPGITGARFHELRRPQLQTGWCAECAPPIWRWS
jgi:integrase